MPNSTQAHVQSTNGDRRSLLVCVFAPVSGVMDVVRIGLYKALSAGISAPQSRVSQAPDTGLISQSSLRLSKAQKLFRVQACAETP
jgi:hypothetical protein